MQLSESRLSTLAIVLLLADVLVVIIAIAVRFGVNLDPEEAKSGAW